jgi:hypothetical protein
MVYRRKPRRYIRRVKRGRIYKRRIPRPIKGSGYSGKRFFKLKEVQTLAKIPSAVSTFHFTDNPNTAQDWNSFTSLFDSYRCCAIKLHYIPNSNVQNLDSILSTNPYTNSPLYIVHDMNQVITTALATNDIIQYENRRVKSLLRYWTYYAKMRRNVPINTSLTTQVNIGTRGYQPTNNPSATQTVLIGCDSFGSSTTSVQFGTIIITYYCIGKEARYMIRRLCSITRLLILRHYEWITELFYYCGSSQ